MIYCNNTRSLPTVALQHSLLYSSYFNSSGYQCRKQTQQLLFFLCLLNIYCQHFPFEKYPTMCGWNFIQSSFTQIYENLFFNARDVWKFPSDIDKGHILTKKISCGKEFSLSKQHRHWGVVRIMMKIVDKIFHWKFSLELFSHSLTQKFFIITQLNIFFFLKKKIFRIFSVCWWASMSVVEGEHIFLNSSSKQEWCATGGFTLSLSHSLFLRLWSA